MGIIEEIDKMDLSDEVKATLKKEHQAEFDKIQAENDALKRNGRKSSVESEITALSDAGFKDQPGLLKFCRQVFLSDDEEPGIVLLSDDDLGLTGDQATGNRGQKEMTTAETLRQFISLLPKKDDKFHFSDQATLVEDGTPPPSGDEKDEKEKKTEDSKKRLGSLSGQTEARTRKRYGARTIAGA